MKRLILIATMILAACGGGGESAPTAAPALQPTVQAALPVYLVLGQSNASGRALTSDLPATLKASQADAELFLPMTDTSEKMVWHLDGTAWQPLAAVAANFGPELSFGKSMSAYGKLGIIKVAVGGSNLHTDWNPATPAMYYQKTLDTVRYARTIRPIKIVGIVWMQGESDAFKPDTAAAYGANLATFIQDLRRDLGNVNIPFVAGRVNPVDPLLPYVASVRAGIEGITLPGYAWIDCDRLAKNPDDVHYNASGQIDLGNLFADAMVKLGGLPR